MKKIRKIPTEPRPGQRPNTGLNKQKPCAIKRHSAPLAQSLSNRAKLSRAYFCAIKRLSALDSPAQAHPNKNIDNKIKRLRERLRQNLQRRTYAKTV